MDKIFCLGELYNKEDKELIDYKLNNAITLKGDVICLRL